MQRPRSRRRRARSSARSRSPEGSLASPGSSPVYRLDTTSFAIERVDVRGDAAGWISRHRAVLCSAHEIRITGGKIVGINGANEVYADNDKSFVLDTGLLVWRVEDAESAALS